MTPHFFYENLPTSLKCATTTSEKIRAREKHFKNAFTSKNTKMQQKNTAMKHFDVKKTHIMSVINCIMSDILFCETLKIGMADLFRHGKRP